jgi:glutathione S-transferase
MLTLYFSPGACSMASHIGLEETGAPYQAKPILLAKGQQRTDEYRKINPRGKVPALDVDGKILVENTAILTYLARRFPEKKLLPSDPYDEARCISTMCWFSSIVHPAYQHYHRPERFADGDGALAAVK